MAGVYNGWSVPVGRAARGNVLIPKPGLYLHSTTWDNATQILKHGSKAMNRNEIHFPPLLMTKRKAAYLRRCSIRKTHIIVFNGAAAAQVGVKFFLAGNEVITPEGIDGQIPRCNIVSLRTNTSAGRRCLDMEATRADPPVGKPSHDAPPNPAWFGFASGRHLRPDTIGVWP